jgi:hypothetical protein
MSPMLSKLSKYKFVFGSVALVAVLGLGFQNCTSSLLPGSSSSVNSLSATALSPVSGTISVNSQLQITATNTPAGTTFVLVSGGGSVDPNTGIYTAPNANTVALIALQTNGVTWGAPSTITVSGTPETVVVNPNPAVLMVGTALTLSGAGGTGPYNFTITPGGSGSGTLDPVAGLFTAVSAGTVNVTAVDAVGVSGTAVLTIEPVISASLSAASILVAGTSQLSVTGGIPPYTYSILSGGSGSGTVDPVAGLFTSTAVGTVNVGVVDSASNSTSTIVTVMSAVSVSAPGAPVAVGGSLTVSASGGSGSGYVYSITPGGSGSGTIDPNLGVFNATVFGSINVSVTDSLGDTGTMTFTVSGPVCALVSENGTALVSCPAGTTIQSIGFASFGTPSAPGGDCTQGLSLGSCNGSNSVTVVSSLCQGQSSCSVPASNGTFGDPCSGTAKALGIQVTCQ